MNGIYMTDDTVEAFYYARKISKFLSDISNISKIEITGSEVRFHTVDGEDVVIRSGDT